MKTTDINDELEQLYNKCSALEEKAGISQLIQHTRMRRLIPRGTIGQGVTPGEYYADEYEYFRTKTRDAYFSIKDLDVRKRLIKLRRKIEKYETSSFDLDLVASQLAVSEVKQKSRRQIGIGITLLVVGLVAVGYWIFNLAGALAGAVGGFFLGKAIIARVKRDALSKLEKAQKELQELQKYKMNRALKPECFNTGEAMTGQRDTQFDRQCPGSQDLPVSICR